MERRHVVRGLVKCIRGDEKTTIIGACDGGQSYETAIAQVRVGRSVIHLKLIAARRAVSVEYTCGDALRRTVRCERCLANHIAADIAKKRACCLVACVLKKDVADWFGGIRYKQNSMDRAVEKYA